MLQNRLFELEDQFEESTGEKLEQQIRLHQIRSIQQNLSKFLSYVQQLNVSGLIHIQNPSSTVYCSCVIRYWILIEL